jgi:hypothetical protein
VMRKVTNVDIIFLYQCKVGVGQSREGGRRRRCGFNASVLARVGRRRDEALSKDEAEAASSS